MSVNKSEKPKSELIATNNFEAN